MKRVLFLTYWFSPLNVVGSIRAVKLAKFLPNYDIEPVIFTTELSQFRNSDILDEDMEMPPVDVIRGKSLDISQSFKSLIGRIRPGTSRDVVTSIPGREGIASKIYNNVMSLPDPQLGWYLLSRREALQICREERIDALFSSAPPFSGHLMGSYLKKRLGIPWICDYRDLWSNNNLIYHKRGVFARLDGMLERKHAGMADIMVSAVPTCARRLEELHTRLVHTVRNGFDPDDYTMKVKSDSLFTVTYTGIIYPGFEDPSLLFQAVNELIQEGLITREKIRVDFYGRRLGSVVEMSGRYGITDVVSVHGQISSQEVKKRQMASTVLLLIDWMGEDPTAQAMHGKFYEYLGAARPILCIGRHRSIIADALKKTGAGCFVTTVDDAKRQLLSLYNEFYSRGGVSYTGDPGRIGEYTSEKSSERLAELIHSVT